MLNGEYSTCVSTCPILPFDWVFHSHLEKHKCSLFPNLSLPNSNPETASYLTVLKGYRAVMLVCEYSPFCLSVTASATVWRHLSALALSFQEGKRLPQRAIVT